MTKMGKFDVLIKVSVTLPITNLFKPALPWEARITNGSVCRSTKAIIACEGSPSNTSDSMVAGLPDSLLVVSNKY